MNKLQKAIDVKDVENKSRWVFADVFLAVMSLAILNATLVYATLITLQFSRVTELVISGVLVLILNLHIAKRIF